MMKKKKFTLIELIISISILAILMSLSLPNLFQNSKSKNVMSMLNDIYVLEDCFKQELKTNKAYPLGNKVDIETIEKGGTLKEEMLKCGQDDLSQVFLLDTNKIKKYNIETKNNLENYYYSAKSKQIFYPKGEEDSDKRIIYHNYKNQNYHGVEELPKDPIKPEEIPAEKTHINGGWYNSVLLYEDKVYQAGLFRNDKMSLVQGLPDNIVQTYTHYYTNFAVSEDGRFFVWGQVGNDGRLKEVPIEIKNIQPVKKVYSRFSVVYLLTNTNRVLKMDLTTLAVEDMGVSNIVDVAIEKDFALFLNNTGDVYAYGVNYFGQLGLGDTKTITRPIKVPNIPKIEDVEIGFDTSYFITKEGEIYTCGRNDYGQLGLGYVSTYNDSKNWTAQKIPGLKNIRKIAVNDSLIFMPKIFAIDNNNEVFYWGNDLDSEVLNARTSVSTPFKYEHLKDVNDITIVGSQNFALLNDGDVYSWGRDNGLGSLGQGQTLESFKYPTKINGVSEIIKIENGLQHTLVVDKNNIVYVWGHNANHQLGVGDPFPRYYPTKIVF